MNSQERVKGLSYKNHYENKEITPELCLKKIQYKKLSKYHSNLGDKKYIELYCPRCYKSEVYGHLHWSAFKCGGCKGYIDKTDYLIRK